MAPKRKAPNPSAEELLSTLYLQVNAAVTVCDHAMRTHQGNRQLVDLALDIRNTLTPRT